MNALLWFNGYGVSVLQEEKRSGDQLHIDVKALLILPNCAEKQLRRHILCYEYASIIKKKKMEREPARTKVLGEVTRQSV